MTCIGQFEFISHHGRLLQAHTDGEMHASQEVQNCGEEERWLVYAWPDGKVSLQNFRSKLWLCAEPSGKAICNRPQPDVWEQWEFFSSGSGTKVSFQSHHKKWLCAQPPDDDVKVDGETLGEVIADRGVCDIWERFSMIPSQGIPVSNPSIWNAIQGAFAVAQEIAPLLIPVL